MGRVRSRVEVALHDNRHAGPGQWLVGQGVVLVDEGKRCGRIFDHDQATVLDVGLRVHLAAEGVADEFQDIDLPGYPGWLALRGRVDVQEDHALDDIVLVAIEERVRRHGRDCARTSIAHGRGTSRLPASWYGVAVTCRTLIGAMI